MLWHGRKLRWFCGLFLFFFFFLLELLFFVDLLPALGDQWQVSFKAMRGQRHSACGLLLWHGCMYPKGRARERLNTDAIRFGTHTAYIICIQEAHGLCQICSYHCCWD